MTENNSSIGFAGLLTVLFVGLKLTNIISWTWWWVLSPLWISAGLALVFIAILGIYYIFFKK